MVSMHSLSSVLLSVIVVMQSALATPRLHGRAAAPTISPVRSGVCSRGLRSRGPVGDERGMAALTSVPVSALPYERFAQVLGPDRFAQFREAADHARTLLDGRVVWNVNSTARGGGVAEML